MNVVRFDIISIGALGRNLLWNETEPVRANHATTTLIRAGGRNILVDPGLPGELIEGRLFERTGLRPDKIDTVFLTNFHPARRGGLEAVPHARVLLHEHEMRMSQQFLKNLINETDLTDPQRETLENELALLNRCHIAPDQLVDQVDLFPLFGVTPGNCGLLLALPTITVVIAGAAVASEEHFLAGQTLPEAYDVQMAHESLREVYEIADVVVPGHGNLFLNPRMHGF